MGRKNVKKSVFLAMKLVIVGVVVAGPFALVATAAPADKRPSTVAVPAVVEAMQKKYGLPSTKVEVVLPAVITLGQLVDLQRQSYPDAVVTSTFYDYRAVSMYRRRAGLHLGYDIAMPARSAVRAGWPGTVVSIAPWSDCEWGVTVQSSDGREVTYGHISPTVRVGAHIDTGSIVGLVAINHVDVKMRDANGNYVPFGEGQQKGVAGAYTRVVARSTREQLMVAWLAANNGLETSETELATRQREAALAKTERKRLEARYAELKNSLPVMQQYAADGLVAKAEVEKLRGDCQKAAKELAECKKTQAEAPKRMANLQKHIKASRARLAQVEKDARQRGLSWADVTAFVNNLVAKDQALSSKVVKYKQGTKSQDAAKEARLRKQVADGRERLKKMEELYEMGGLSRKDIEAMRAKQSLLENELQSL